MQMLPAAHRAEAPDAGTVMDREIAAIAFAIDGALGVGWP